MLVLSNCTNVSGDATAEDKSDIVLMPSISHGAKRGHDKNEKTSEDEPPTKKQAKKTDKEDKTTHVPTAAQQEAAIKALSTPEPTAKATDTPTAIPVTVPEPTPSPSAPNPSSTEQPAAPLEDDAPPAPRPNSVELRGLRTPTLPGILPMEVKG